MESQSNEMSTKRSVIGLDIVRFVAALMVMMFHLGYLVWARPRSTPGQIASDVVSFPSLEFFSFGWIGVQIFFVLSGFVIAFSANGASPFDFARSRVLRLYPAAWGCACITLAAWLLVGAADLPDLVLPWIKSLVLFPIGPWIDGVYWTLSVEIAFYATVFAVLMSGSSRRLIPLLYGLITASALFQVDEHTFHLLRNLIPPKLLPLLLLEHGVHFAIGGILWLTSSTGWTRLRGAMLVTALVVGTVQIHNQVSLADDLGTPWPAILVWGLGVLAIALSPKINRVIWSAERARLARSLGLATYPLYLLHDVVGAAMLKALSFLGAWALIVIVPTMVLAAVAISHSFEPWVRNRLAGPVTAARSASARWPRLMRKTIRVGG